MNERTARTNPQQRFWEVMANCCVGLSGFGGFLLVATLVMVWLTGGAAVAPAVIYVGVAGGPILLVGGLLATVFCLSRADRRQEPMPEPRKGRGYLGEAKWRDEQSAKSIPLPRVSFRRDALVALGSVAVVSLIVFGITALGPQTPEACGAFGGELVCERNLSSVAPTLLIFLLPLTTVLALYASWKIADWKARKRAE